MTLAEVNTQPLKVIYLLTHLLNNFAYQIIQTLYNYDKEYHELTKFV